jgi:hypothetical protein
MLPAAIEMPRFAFRTGAPMRPYLLLIAFLVACGEHKTSGVTVTVDTLPSGVITVRNSAPMTWGDSAHLWRFVEIARIEGTADTASPLIAAGNSALDPLGRIVVVEESPSSIKIFERDGRLVRKFGREGGGPGEFRNPAIAAFGPFIVADEPGLARLEVFDSTGKLLREFPAPCCYYYGIFADDSNRVIARTSPGSDSTKSGAFVRINVVSGAADTIMLGKLGDESMWTLKAGDGAIRYGIPYSPHDVVGFTASGHVLHGWSSSYRWVEQSLSGDTLRVVTRDWTPVERPEALRRAQYDTMVKRASRQFGEAAVREAFHYSDIPATAEAMRDIEGDPAGRIWVTVFTGDTLHREYDVFDANGVLQARAVAPWPKGEFLQWRTADEVLTQGETPEGFPMLRVWRLEQGGR